MDGSVPTCRQSYLIRSKSKRHGKPGRGPSPIKTLFSPGGTARKVEDGGEDDVRHLTKELLDLKTRCVVFRGVMGRARWNLVWCGVVYGKGRLFASWLAI